MLCHTPPKIAEGMRNRKGAGVGGCASRFWAIATTGARRSGGLLRCLTVSCSLIEFQVRVHRRDAEDTEAAQSP
jgi:hypothetical protein